MASMGNCKHARGTIIRTMVAVRNMAYSRRGNRLISI